MGLDLSSALLFIVVTMDGTGIAGDFFILSGHDNKL